MRWTGIILRVVLIVLIGIFGRVAYLMWNATDNAIEVALEWSRMAEIPKELTVASVEVKGSKFTRELILTIEGKTESIERWLESSPGVKDAKQTVKQGNITYSIQPGGGAQFAEVVYFKEKLIVVIRVSWS